MTIDVHTILALIAIIASSASLGMLLGEYIDNYKKRKK